jgi:pimeloyl-ACP methyl ester carboxylesterase
MKRTYTAISKIVFVLSLTISIVSSCKKDNPPANYSYFVSKELVSSYSSSYISNLVASISIIYPEINDYKSHFNGNVNVYRIIYKTAIKGEMIEASGLVCTPSIPGAYPVVCFQNGTNTVNANSPSNSPSDASYQMIELASSMGYVVVIPDYPGFGASAQIPHPYLIVEPTVRSIVDMLLAVKELGKSDIPGISLKNQYFLIGYSQGGWATMALHKALETEYSNEFNLGGSVCGAGPYDINYLFQTMINASSYPVPGYLGYIVYAYSSYNQFTNPVNDILNEPYASRLSSLYTGLLNMSQINGQLTTSITGLIKPDFISGFSTLPKFSTVRDALTRNSLTAWHTYKPLYMLHGGSDTQVNPAVTTYFYDAMIAAGTSSGICTKEILPGLDHGDGVAPSMIKGFKFILNLTAPN